MTVTKKLQRVGMAGRLGLPEIADSTPAQQRLFEATCPAGHSSPQQTVPCAPVAIAAGARAISPEPTVTHVRFQGCDVDTKP